MLWCQVTIMPIQGLVQSGQTRHATHTVTQHPTKTPEALCLSKLGMLVLHCQGQQRWNMLYALA